MIRRGVQRHGRGVVAAVSDFPRGEGLVAVGRRRDAQRAVAVALLVRVRVRATGLGQGLGFGLGSGLGIGLGL